MISRADLITEARKYIGAKFAHQGRTPDKLDCGGLVLLVGRGLNLTALEFLGYANFPSGGKFEDLLAEHAAPTDDYFRYPHRWQETDLMPGDILSFDYGNGEGVRHVAFVTKFDGRRFWVIDAQPDWGVAEHPLAHPFFAPKTVLRRYLVKFDS